MKLLLAFFALAVSSQAATLIRVQCGGPAGVDSAGNAWQADGYFAGGARWDASNQASMANQPVPYRSLRYGTNVSYTLPAPAGAYKLTLMFLEPNKTAAGQRVFSVSVNGVVMAPALDLFAVAGQAPGLNTPSGTLTPYDVTYPVTSTGQIKVDLVASVGNVVISAIQLDDVPPPPPPPPPSTGEVFAPGPGIQFDKSGDTGQTIIRLDPNYQGVGFKPWISPLFQGPDASVTILGKDHGIRYLPNCAIVVEVWDASDPATIRRITADVIAEDVVSINRQTCDVRIDFKAPRSQYLVVVR